MVTFLIRVAMSDIINIFATLANYSSLIKYVNSIRYTNSIKYTSFAQYFNHIGT